MQYTINMFNRFIVKKVVKESAHNPFIRVIEYHF